MSTAVAHIAPMSGAPTRAFYALVKSVHTGMLSSKVNCLFVEVLSGTVDRGDALEVVHVDGAVAPIAARRIREALGDTVLDLDEPQPQKGDLAGAALVRAAGLAAPPLPGDRDPGLERLLASVAAARAEGFPTAWAQPIRPLGGHLVDELCALLRMLPDEAVALLARKRVRDATAHHDNPFAIMGDIERAAMLLNAIGMPDDGDRLLLTASAAVQGHQASTALRAAGTVGAVGVLATEPIVEGGLDIGRRVGWAIGIEMGDAFAKGFQSSVSAGGEVVEGALLDAGRAVGVGRCKSCHEVVAYRFRRGGLTSSPQFHCPNDDRKAGERILVIPADVPAALELLRSGAH